MPSCEVTFAEIRKITIWIPKGATNAEKASLAMDHMAFYTLKGRESKLLSIIEDGALEAITEPTAAPIK